MTGWATPEQSLLSAAERDHESAWEWADNPDPDAKHWGATHEGDPLECRGCAWIERIEADARASVVPPVVPPAVPQRHPGRWLVALVLVALIVWRKRL